MIRKHSPFMVVRTKMNEEKKKLYEVAFGEPFNKLKTIQYNWKEKGWKDLREYPSAWVEWEMNKLHMLYSYEYKFRIK